MSLVQSFRDAFSDLVSPPQLNELLRQLEIVQYNVQELAATPRMRMGSLDLGAAEGFIIYNPDTGAPTIKMEPVGNAWFGADLDDPTKTSLVIFSIDQEYNEESVGEGDVLLGDNSSSKANLLWDRSTGNLLFRGGTTANIKLDTSGNLVFQDDIFMGQSSRGIWFKDTNATTKFITWSYQGDTESMCNIYGDYGSGSTAIMWMNVVVRDSFAWTQGDIVLSALDYSTGAAYPDTRLTLSSSGTLTSSSGHVLLSGSPGDLRIKGGLMVGDDGTDPAAGEIWTTGDVYVNKGDSSNAVNLYVDGAAGTNRALWIRTGTSARWKIQASNDSESGSDAGSELEILAYDDSGSWKVTPLRIFRASGNILVNKDLYTDTWQNYYSSSTVVGLSSPTATDIYYKRLGNLVFVSFNLGGPSSASTSFTFTVPYTSAAGVAHRFMIRCNDNSGTFQPGTGRLPASSNLVTLYSDYTNSLWTGSSGNRNAQGQFTYEAQ